MFFLTVSVPLLSSGCGHVLGGLKSLNRRLQNPVSRDNNGLRDYICSRGVADSKIVHATIITLRAFLIDDQMAGSF